MKLLSIFLVLFSIIFTNAQSIEVFESEEGVSALLLSGDYVYFAGGYTTPIHKINIENEIPVPELVCMGSDMPISMALFNQTMYFSEWSSGSISTFNILNAPSNRTELISGLNECLKLLINGNELYISDSNLHQILKMDLSVENPTLEVVIFDNSIRPYGMDIKDNELYFSDDRTIGNIYKFDVTSPSPELILVKENVKSPGHLKFLDNELYICQMGTEKKISKIDVSINSPELIEVITDISTPFDLFFKDNYLYYSEFSTGKLWKVDLDLLGVDDIEESTYNTLYPNPAMDFLKIINIPSGMSYQIVSYNGSLIEKGTISDENHVNISHLAKGNYFISLENGESYSFIKQ